MRRFAKFILIGVGVFLLLYTLAVLGMNIYLQSASLQERIRSAAETAAGSPVKIHGTHYTPWSGFSVTEISVNGPGIPGHPPMLTAASLSFRFDVISLLAGKLVISEVLVKDPQLQIQPAAPEPQVAANSAGVPAPAGAVPAEPTPVQAPPAETTPSGGVVITVPTPAVPVQAVPIVTVKRVRILNGAVQVFDSKGTLAAILKGVGISCVVHPAKSAEGDFQVAETTVGAFAHPNHVKGSFTWEGGRLQIPDLQADWAGGKLTGTVNLEADRKFVLTAASEGVLIKKLAEDAGISGEGSRGSLFAKANLQGMAGRPETFTGRVELSLQEARFQPLDFIRQIGELLSIQELQMLELKTAEAVLTIHDRKVVTETLVLESENLVLDAKGPTSFEGKMKLQARLLLNERLRKDLAGLLGNNFKDSERPGYQQMPFSVTGTVSHPKTDLLDKLTGFRIGQDVGGLLKNLFKAAPEKKAGTPAPAKAPGGG